MKRVLLMAAAAVMLTACGVYSEGERTGQVTKLSEKGIIFKTHEGELVMSGMKTRTDGEGRSSVIANVFEYSVTDPAIVAKINAAARTGDPVTLVYDQYLIPAPVHRKTSYIIRDVLTE